MASFSLVGLVSLLDLRDLRRDDLTDGRAATAAVDTADGCCSAGGATWRACKVGRSPTIDVVGLTPAAVTGIVSVEAVDELFCRRHSSRRVAHSPRWAAARSAS